MPSADRSMFAETLEGAERAGRVVDVEGLADLRERCREAAVPTDLGVPHGPADDLLDGNDNCTVASREEPIEVSLHAVHGLGETGGEVLMEPLAGGLDDLGRRLGRLLRRP